VLSPNVLCHLPQRIRDTGKALGYLRGVAPGLLGPDKHRPYSPQGLPNGPANLPVLKILARPGLIITLSRSEKAYRAFSVRIALTAVKRAGGP